jgi:hypothetical protein
MNIRLLLCIIMGVFTAHIGMFMLISQFKPKPKLVARERPNFSAKSYPIVDAETGEKVIYREITVSTKFAPESSLPPAAGGASAGSSSSTDGAASLQ